MPPIRTDIIGKRFGRLAVVRRHSSTGKSVRWLCACDCGAECYSGTWQLTGGSKKSCGCLKESIKNKPHLEEWTEANLAYAAGFLDGEGTFTVSGAYQKIQVRCSNTNRPVIDWLQYMFGGSTNKKPIKGRKPNHRPMHQWQVSDRGALALCQAVAPYLREKTEQALLLIAIQQTRTSHGNVCDEVADERVRLARILKEKKRVSWE